jgi:hypothetical protein
MIGSISCFALMFVGMTIDWLIAWDIGGGLDERLACLPNVVSVACMGRTGLGEGDDQPRHSLGRRDWIRLFGLTYRQHHHQQQQRQVLKEGGGRGQTLESGSALAGVIARANPIFEIDPVFAECSYWIPNEIR